MFKAHRLCGAVQAIIAADIAIGIPPIYQVDRGSTLALRRFITIGIRLIKIQLRAVSIGTLLNFRVNISQKCAAVPRRARI